MVQKISIRLITEKDIPALLDIENSIWTNENSPVIHHYNSLEEYRDKIVDRTIFVATDNQQILGFVDVQHPTPLVAHQKQWVLAIGVGKEMQSKGVGKRLVDYVKIIAAEADIHKLSLRVMGTNTKAIQFYKKNDFVQEGHFKDEFFMNGSFCDDYQFAYFIEKT